MPQDPDVRRPIDVDALLARVGTVSYDEALKNLATIDVDALLARVGTVNYDEALKNLATIDVDALLENLGTAIERTLDAAADPADADQTSAAEVAGFVAVALTLSLAVHLAASTAAAASAEAFRVAWFLWCVHWALLDYSPATAAVVAATDLVRAHMSVGGSAPKPNPAPAPSTEWSTFGPTGSLSEPEVSAMYADCVALTREHWLAFWRALAANP